MRIGHVLISVSSASQGIVYRVSKGFRLVSAESHGTIARIPRPHTNQQRPGSNDPGRCIGYHREAFSILVNVPTRCQGQCDRSDPLIRHGIG